MALTTDITLIARVAADPTDRDAWARFVFLYGPQVFHWCRGFGLQDADARDVTQDVLLKLCVQMGRFRYDPARPTNRSR